MSGGVWELTSTLQLYADPMNKIFYKPLEKIMTERESYINTTISSAEISSNKANEILKDKEEKIKKSTSDSKKYVADKVYQANQLADSMISEAKSKSKSEITQAKQDLIQKEKILKQDLEPEVKKLAGIISSKILGFESEVESF